MVHAPHRQYPVRFLLLVGSSQVREVVEAESHVCEPDAAFGRVRVLEIGRLQDGEAVVFVVVGHECNTRVGVGYAGSEEGLVPLHHFAVVGGCGLEDEVAEGRGGDELSAVAVVAIGWSGCCHLLVFCAYTEQECWKGRMC